MFIKYKYIYGFIKSQWFESVKNILEEAGLSLVTYDDVSAVVADTTIEKIEHLDKESLAYKLVEHQKNIEIIMNTANIEIIPVQFGTIMNSENDIIQALRCGKKIIGKSFESISGYVEYDLVAQWGDFGKILNQISDDPEVKLKKEKILLSSVFNENDAINIGKLIKQKIDEQNSKINAEINEKIMPYCDDNKIHQSMNDEMPVNTAYLLKKENVGQLFKMIDNLDKKYSNDLNFKIVGPLPCYSFYTIECKLLDYEDILKAKNILRISELNSEKEIKSAYLKKAAESHPDKNINNDKNSDEFLKIHKAYTLMMQYADIINQAGEQVSMECLYHIKIKN
jgi:hypothetical protein